MPRPTGFQFKQFTVAHDQCAMKVSLDACLFGALIDADNAQRILDIGTGTGLLSLMIAQRCQGQIDAVELDNNAAAQARTNIANSPFAKQIKVHTQAIQQFTQGDDVKKYDCIVCNPPFFNQHLLGHDPQRNLARHNTQLCFADLCQSIKSVLADDGHAWLLLPQHSHASFLANANQWGLHLIKQYSVIARQNTPSKLGIWVYRHKAASSVEKNTITVYQADSDQYTAQFSQLLADYYLKL